MIDKYLRKFCAQEIQILIAKMEDDYGAFSAYHSPWMRLLDAKRYMTKIERYCVNKAHARAASGHERQQYLAMILKNQLNPMTREEVEDNSMMDSARYSQMQTYKSQIAQAHAQAQKMQNTANLAAQYNAYQQGNYK
jgi:hypothetical protein